MPRTFARVRRSVFGTRPVLWTGGAIAWSLVAAGFSPLLEKPLVWLVVPFAAFAVHTLPMMKSYRTGPWTFLDTAAFSGVGTLLPLIADMAFGPLDRSALAFLCAMSAIFLPGVMAMLWPLPRVSADRLRRDVEEAVLHALADGHLDRRGTPIARVILDPSVCHGMDAPFDVYGAMGRQRVSLDNHFVRPHAFPLLVTQRENDVLSLNDGLPLELLAPYALPVALPTTTWQAFPDLIVWEAPTSAHGRLALAEKVARVREGKGVVRASA